MNDICIIASNLFSKIFRTKEPETYFSIAGKKLEIVTAVFTFLWGIWIFNPFVESFANTSISKFMAELAPELLWGIVYTLYGIAMVVISYKGSHRLRIITSIVSMFLWIILAILVLMANPAAPAFALYLGIAFCSWLTNKTLVDDYKIICENCPDDTTEKLGGGS